jgi:hypothetical protein
MGQQSPTDSCQITVRTGFDSRSRATWAEFVTGDSAGAVPRRLWQVLPHGDTIRQVVQRYCRAASGVIPLGGVPEHIGAEAHSGELWSVTGSRDRGSGKARPAGLGTVCDERSESRCFARGLPGAASSACIVFAEFSLTVFAFARFSDRYSLPSDGHRRRPRPSGIIWGRG